jgi:hypothetical protein
VVNGNLNFKRLKQKSKAVDKIIPLDQA